MTTCDMLKRKTSPAARSLGEKGIAMLPSLQKAAGTGNVKIIPAKMGAEDYSFYGEKVPALFFNLGGMPKGQNPKTTPSHHTADFFVDESGMKTGIKAFLYLVTDYMQANSGKAQTKSNAKSAK